MRYNGAQRIYAKRLAPNDNSKNQVYLGGGFGALNIIPHGEIITDDRPLAGAKRERPKATVDFWWVDDAGIYNAPDAQLILYPDYPEVRMSGFLKGCRAAPSEVMRVRDEGRALFFGILPSGRVLGYATTADDPITLELNAHQWDMIGVFAELPLSLAQPASTKSLLLAELKRIHDLGWIMSQKLARNGAKEPYAAMNGGGYTLEAELGITPNGIAEPDFQGWEVKQYGVRDFVRYLAKTPVTLMTPEPTGGIYQEDGISAFLTRYGYIDKNGRADRRNFGGIYAIGRDFHADTGVKLIMSGFDSGSGKMTDLDGGMMLIDRNDQIAASWSFKGMMAHWNRKHAQAAYVPSLIQGPPPEYSYGSRVLICEQTDFILFLKAFANGFIYYDPAIKIENASTSKPTIKRRSQFRVSHAKLTGIYHASEVVFI
jgi:MvaI/BcnI restriction endonuclease family